MLKKWEGVRFIAVKKEKYDKEWSIKTLFSVADNFELKFIRTMSKKGLVVKILLNLLALNFYRW